MKHLLVTNDFPPKVGGIQSYLWELWRRLPADDVTVLTTAHPNAAAFDRLQPFRVERVRSTALLPTPATRRRVERLAAEVGAALVVIDPASPLGWLGPQLGLPYGVVLHGAEVTVPAHLPVLRRRLRDVLAGASVIVAAGSYPAAQARRVAGADLPITVVPPGVDATRFRPLDAEQRAAARHRFGLRETGRLVVSVSRLVPRKGMDVLIRTSADLVPVLPDLQVAIAGVGRDRDRLERLVQATGAPVRFLGKVPDSELPLLHGAADVFVMLCRDRWFGLEQEGFGIVFLEAAACGVPQVAGRSGGSHEAVEDEITGLVVRRPRSEAEALSAMSWLLANADVRERMGEAARRRAVASFDYDVLVTPLRGALEEAAGVDTTR